MVIGNRCVNIRAPDAVQALILNRAEVGLKLAGTIIVEQCCCLCLLCARSSVG